MDPAIIALLERLGPIVLERAWEALVAGRDLDTMTLAEFTREDERLELRRHAAAEKIRRRLAERHTP